MRRVNIQIFSGVDSDVDAGNHSQVRLNKTMANDSRWLCRLKVTVPNTIRPKCYLSIPKTLPCMGKVFCPTKALTLFLSQFMSKSHYQLLAKVMIWWNALITVNYPRSQKQWKIGEFEIRWRKNENAAQFCMATERHNRIAWFPMIHTHIECIQNGTLAATLIYRKLYRDPQMAGFYPQTNYTESISVNSLHSFSNGYQFQRSSNVVTNHLNRNRLLKW